MPITNSSTIEYQRVVQQVLTHLPNDEWKQQTDIFEKDNSEL